MYFYMQICMSGHDAQTLVLKGEILAFCLQKPWCALLNTHGHSYGRGFVIATLIGSGFSCQKLIEMLMKP